MLGNTELEPTYSPSAVFQNLTRLAVQVTRILPLAAKAADRMGRRCDTPTLHRSLPVSVSTNRTTVDSPLYESIRASVMPSGETANNSTGATTGVRHLP